MDVSEVMHVCIVRERETRLNDVIIYHQMQFVEQLNAALEGTLAPNTETIKQVSPAHSRRHVRMLSC